MISYEDLVVALAAWRARQGLPVAQVAGSVAPARTAPPPAPAQARAAPPAAPPRSHARSAEEDFEDSALVEESPYDEDAYVVESSEATAIGDAPEPVADVLPRRGKRPDR